MKKFFILSVAALTALFSCTQEPIGPKDNLQKLTFTGVTDAVKTTLQEDYSITWSTEDDITVFAGDNADGVSFDVTATARNGHEATFSGSAEASATYYALSPAQTGASISNGMISAVLPTVQTATANSFAPEANVSVATASDYVFQFKNTGALIAVKPGNEGITAIKLEALGGEVLSGTAVIDPADGSLVSKSGESYVQLEGSFTRETKYYFVVLPGTYAGGFRITLFKGAEYARFSKSASATLERNGNLDLLTLTGTSWKTAFVEGEELVIKGSEEDGQALAYVASDGYWNESVQYSNVANYPYSYEIFTRLNQGQKFYFEAAGGEKFGLNAEGTAVTRLAKTADAAYGAPATGIYRIRLNFPDGGAEVKQISEVTYDLYGLDSRSLSYQRNGIWSSDNFHIRTSSYMNRYRFLVKFTDDTKQYYGRHRSSGGNPTYGTTTADYFYVQPSIDSDADHWSPCFQYPSAYENISNRYYCTMTLSLNNDEGHYTHSVTKVWDKQNPLTGGEEVRVWGSAVASPDVAGVEMRYSTAFYNTGVPNAGDRVDQSPTMDDPVGYDYEIFIKLSDGQKFYFSTESGYYFGLNSAGNGIEGIFTENDLSYGGVSSGGLYRIRIKSSSGEAALRQVGEARYLQPNRGTNTVLSYAGNGTWTGAIPFGWTNPKGWGSNSVCVFKFQIYFMDTWQFYGRYNTENVYTSRFIQPITDTSSTASWDNFLTVENDPDYGIPEYMTEYGYCDMTLQLNASGYTYRIKNIRQ